ncbi:hypothetical protein ACFVFI_04685 [Streptomyces sp. NPDC057705]|uniref:hypothetical protein n=1 Tax=Streptomyces sp. NPDC057705 TaxID=3346222 RepID=UPI0036AE20F5
MRVQHFGGAHSLTTTVQVANQDVFVDIGLYSMWHGGTEYGAGIAHVSQIVSASGVENFSTEWNSLASPSALFRKNVTSVTFKVEVFEAQAMARWMIYTWG